MTFSDPLRIGVITLSDRASRGEYEDLSGPLLKELVSAYLQEKDIRVEFVTEIIPDDPGQLKNLIISHREQATDVVFTTGGTGLGPRDFTPDVVKPLLDKEIPGVMEMIRVKYGSQKPAALVSRSIAGLTGTTLVYCLPGSKKAVAEYCAEILPTLIHTLKMVRGMDDHTC